MWCCMLAPEFRVWHYVKIYSLCIFRLIHRVWHCFFSLPLLLNHLFLYLATPSPASSTMLSRCKSFCYPDNQNNWTSITWDRFYSSSATWPRLLRRYHWASHVWKRRRASLRYFSPFPPRRWPTPCLVLLVVACCWMCVPRSAVPENLPPRALPQRRGPERSLWRFSPPAKPGAFSARLGSKVNQLSLQLTCTYIEHTANSKLFLVPYKQLYLFPACILCRLISLR